MSKKILVTGGNSGIGASLITQLSESNIKVDATFRNDNSTWKTISKQVETSFQVDFSNADDVEQFATELDWTQYFCVVFIHGTMEPIGKLADVRFTDWLTAQQVNYHSIVQCLQSAIKKATSSIKFITLAGGGVNGAPEKYNAYTSSKVSLVKMTELLAVDYPEHCFINVGPGWVDTPIHKQTLANEKQVPESAAETKRRYSCNEFVPMSYVVEAFLKLIKSAGHEYSGRNFSVASGELFEEGLAAKLQSDQNLFKLRRYQG